MRYLHLLSWVAGAAWAMEPVKAQIILDVLLRRALDVDHVKGQDIHDDYAEERERQRRVETRQAAERRAQDERGGIAIVPLHGVISPRVHDVQGRSTGGGVAAEGFAAALRQLAADPNVSSIIVDVDSPGGNIAGIAEAVAAIREAKAAKPVVALAHHWAASAAYWIASNASELVVTPSGEVGSVGVYAYHEDISKAMEARGIKPTLISAGPHKGEGHPAFPLSEEAFEHMQGRVNAAHSAFVADVAKGRGVTPAVVRESFGGGRMVDAKEAVKLGMADRVDTMDGVIKRLQKSAGRSRPAATEMRRRRLAVA